MEITINVGWLIGGAIAFIRIAYAFLRLKYRGWVQSWQMRDRICHPTAEDNPDWRTLTKQSNRLRGFLADRNDLLRAHQGDWPVSCHWVAFGLGDYRDREAESLLKTLAKLNLKMLLYEPSVESSKLIRELKKYGITFCALFVTIATIAVVTCYRVRNVISPTTVVVQ